jgi:hypothetical protein
VFGPQPLLEAGQEEQLIKDGSDLRGLMFAFGGDSLGGLYRHECLLMEKGG